MLSYQDVVAGGELSGIVSRQARGGGLRALQVPTPDANSLPKLFESNVFGTWQWVVVVVLLSCWCVRLVIKGRRGAHLYRQLDLLASINDGCTSDSSIITGFITVRVHRIPKLARTSASTSKPSVDPPRNQITISHIAYCIRDNLKAPKMSSPATLSPMKRARRPSKFIEGSAATGPELLLRTPTTKQHFHTILAEMDKCEERKRRHRGSSSSVESLTSHDIKRRMDPPYPAGQPKEGTRSVNFGRRSSDVRPVAVKEEDGEGKNKEVLKRTIKGRLRALTGGRERNVQPYPGT